MQLDFLSYFFFLCLCYLLSLMLKIFAGAFPENYEPPPGGFYFEVNDKYPIIQV